MSRRWGNERGSALLLVFVAVTVLGIMIGGVALAVHNSANQSIVHERQVQAEFRAQQSMELAVYMLYNKPTDFTAIFRKDPTDLTGLKNCLSNPQDSDIKVCLQTSTDAQGLPVETLVASAGVSGQNGSEKPESVIRFQLTASDLPVVPGGDVTPIPTPTPTPTPDPTPTPTPTPTPSGPYLGEEICGKSNTYLMRALVLGNEMDLSQAMLETTRRALKNDSYAYKSGSVEINGGLYVDNGADMVLARPKNNDKFDILSTVYGWVKAEGGLDWSQGNGHQSDLQYSLLGPNAQEDACSRNVNYHTYMTQLGNNVYTRLQSVPVYYFTGDLVTTNSRGTMKKAGSSTFTFSNLTLAQVLADKSDKIILVEGNLYLPGPSVDSTGYLIVYNKTSNTPSQILLPSDIVWNHQGAITTEEIVSYENKKLSWPSNYRLYVTLTAQQAALYDQDSH